MSGLPPELVHRKWIYSLWETERMAVRNPSVGMLRTL
jgi:hypothetical protein